MNKLIFREYDIRGIYEKELSPAVVGAIFYALSKECIKKNCKNISIGYDARLSAKALKNTAIKACKANGLKVYDIGLVPTPLGYFSVYKEGLCDANVMITGSHNPKEYNGFKITIKKESFFGKDLQRLYKEAKKYLKVDLSAISYDCEMLDVKSLYISFLSEHFALLKNLDQKIIIDCFNGTAGEVIKALITSLGLKALLLNEKADGNFPKHEPDPSDERNLEEIKAYLKADEIGFAFDGDADRLVVLDKNRVYKGDELCYLFAKDIKNPRVLAEVKCSQNLYIEVAKFGRIYMGKTGHSNIKKAMKEKNIDLAAELSGHIFFADRYFGYDDAIYALFRSLELLFKGYDFNKELLALPRLFASDEEKIKVEEEEKFKIIKLFKKQAKSTFSYKKACEIDGLRLSFEDGWLLLRASNTSPFLILRAEASCEEKKDEYLQKARELLKKIT